MRRQPAGLAMLALAGVLLALLTAGPAAASPASLLHERLCLLQGYIERYANQHYSYYPPASMVRRGAGLPAPVWPRNPWTGAPMSPGSGVGQYEYRPGRDLLGYRLAGRYPGGSFVLTRTIPKTRKMQNDHRTREGLELVQQFVEQWARAHDDLYPAPEQVDASAAVGLQERIVYWPQNPWVHKPMRQSRAWGDFSYTVSASHDRYTLRAWFSRGSSFTLTGATATAPWHRLRLAVQDQIRRRYLQLSTATSPSGWVSPASTLSGPHWPAETPL